MQLAVDAGRSDAVAITLLVDVTAAARQVQSKAKSLAQKS